MLRKLSTTTAISGHQLNHFQPLQLLSQFPKDSMDFCFAYGSGVKKQLGYADSAPEKNMIDIVFCVRNSRQWHENNLKLNPTHYSGVAKVLGSSGIANVQERFGANVYCNTLIPWTNNTTIKYGVISSHHLVRDLVDWNHLYLAGRLHKPVDVLLQPTAAIQEALLTNFKNALHTALLILPEKFKFFDLFLTIANLSYAGDFRMIFGENKNKVKNIVTPQLNDFLALYLPMIEKHICSQHINLPRTLNEEITQSKTTTTLHYHLVSLPRALKRRLINPNQLDSDFMPEKLSNNLNQLSSLIQKQVNQIVWQSSISQSLKNIPTAGFSKTIKYSWAKALKTFN